MSSFPSDSLIGSITAEALTCAEKIACTPVDPRCYIFLDPPHEAQGTCATEGCRLIGWIMARSGRDRWDVWLDVNTGEGPLSKGAARAHAQQLRECVAAKKFITMPRVSKNTCTT